MLGLAVLLIVLAIGAGAKPPPTQAPISAGDTYVEAMVGAPRFVNPFLASTDADTDLTHLVFSGLTRVDEHGNIVPDLASGWQVSPDSSVYTFTLKPNLHWQDGADLTADDVTFTLGTLLQAPDFPGAPTLAAPWHKVDVKLSGAQTISFTLPASDASFLQYTTIGILPKHLWGSTKPAQLAGSPLNQAPVGSGPWRYVQAGAATTGASSSGTSVTSTTTSLAAAASPFDGVLLEPNPYAPPTSMAISRLWFRFYPTFGAALTGFGLGEVHGLGHIPAERIPEVAAISGVTLHRQTLARYNMLLINVASPMFDKAETRQAFELAIDRDALSDEKDGLSRPASNPILTHSWAYDPTLKPSPYNPTEARRLLEVAGWVVSPGGVRVRNGITLTVVLAANKDVPANIDAAQRIADYLRAVGVDARLALVDRAALLRDYLGPRAFHLVLAGWEASGADPDLYQYWHSSQAVTGGLNFTGWSNPAADKALQDARTNPNREVRARLYADFQKAFSEDVPAIILSNPLYIYATRLPAQGVTLPNTDMLSPADRFDTISGWSLQAP